MAKPIRSPKDVEYPKRKSFGPFVTKQDLEKLERLIRLTQKELADGLKAIQTQVGKVAAEQSTRFDTLTAKVEELEAIINAGGDVSQDVTDAMDGVKIALQSLDDTIPDAPPTP